jgi:hypothetical protein
MGVKIANKIRSTMEIQSEKIELAKRLLDTEDQRIIEAIRSVFNDVDMSDEWGDLPDAVISDIKLSMEEIDSGKGLPHSKARETYRKWL